MVDIRDNDEQSLMTQNIVASQIIIRRVGFVGTRTILITEAMRWHSTIGDHNYNDSKNLSDSFRGINYLLGKCEEGKIEHTDVCAKIQHQLLIKYNINRPSWVVIHTSYYRLNMK